MKKKNQKHKNLQQEIKSLLMLLFIKTKLLQGLMESISIKCTSYGVIITRNWSETMHIFNGYFQILFNLDLTHMLAPYLLNKLKFLRIVSKS